MTLETLLGPAVPATYLVLLGLEALRPARAWPAIRFWRLLGGAFFLVMGGVVTVAPLALPPAWIAEHQLHHSTQRVDLSGFAFTHPTEMLATALIAATTTTLMLGIDPRAAALVGYVHGTPRWLSIFFQRPEAHGLHHERGVHHRNFGDLPLWDMVFGTYKNPQRFDGEAGFDQPASGQVGAMLAFADVHGGRL